MPGGWGRTRRDSSPAANSAHLRNAGINPFGREGSPVRSSVPAAGTGTGTGRRLRLADLKREEEESMRMSSMGGDQGEEGYEGVGRAM